MKLNHSLLTTIKFTFRFFAFPQKVFSFAGTFVVMVFESGSFQLCTVELNGLDYVGLVGFPLSSAFSLYASISQAQPSLADVEFFLKSFHMYTLYHFLLLHKRRFAHTQKAELDTLGTHLFVLALAPIYTRTISASNQLTKPKMEWFKLCLTSELVERQTQREKNRHYFLLLCPRWNKPNLCVCIFYEPTALGTHEI